MGRAKLIRLKKQPKPAKERAAGSNDEESETEEIGEPGANSSSKKRRVRQFQVKKKLRKENILLKKIKKPVIEQAVKATVKNAGLVGSPEKKKAAKTLKKMDKSPKKIKSKVDKALAVAKKLERKAKAKAKISGVEASPEKKSKAAKALKKMDASSKVKKPRKVSKEKAAARKKIQKAKKAKTAKANIGASAVGNGSKSAKKKKKQKKKKNKKGGVEKMES